MKNTLPIAVIVAFALLTLAGAAYADSVPFLNASFETGNSFTHKCEASCAYGLGAVPGWMDDDSWHPKSHDILVHSGLHHGWIHKWGNHLPDADSDDGTNQNGSNAPGGDLHQWSSSGGGHLDLDDVGATSTVPEPSSMTFVALGTILFLAFLTFGKRRAIRLIA